jgi:PIN domain nuclease of toxin-antitoxin system
MVVRVNMHEAKTRLSRFGDPCGSGMSLPDHHRDRYCRILMAQALEEDMVIVTRDAAIARYAVPTLLA